MSEIGIEVGVSSKWEEDWVGGGREARVKLEEGGIMEGGVALVVVVVARVEDVDEG
jgi:hypothetical protein